MWLDNSQYDPQRLYSAYLSPELSLSPPILLTSHHDPEGYVGLDPPRLTRLGGSGFVAHWARDAETIDYSLRAQALDSQGHPVGESLKLTSENCADPSLTWFHGRTLLGTQCPNGSVFPVVSTATGLAAQELYAIAFETKAND